MLVPTPTGPFVIPAEANASVSGERVRFSLIIPTYNEAKNLPTLIAQLDSTLRPVLGDSHELLVVDDDSPDKTWAVAEELAKTYPSVRVMRVRCPAVL